MLPPTKAATESSAVEVSTTPLEHVPAAAGHLYPAPPGYDLREEIGKGGMGVVFRAVDHDLNREVAVKILQDRYSPDSKTAARFVEEARITSQLQHPGIPAVYEVSKLADGRPFLAMKLIKGDTLDALLKTNMPINRLAVFESICQALGYAHAHNVIHRDLKPSNIMVGAFGEVQVMDWGLAKVLKVSRETKSSAADDPDATTGPTEIQSHRDSERSVTQAGSVMGTPAFMPPEQAAGEIDKIDQRADVFGLGAILCVLLTGKPPYVGEDSKEVQLKAIRGQIDDALARLDQCAAEPGVVALCKQCLSFQPVDRPGDANAIAQIVGDLRRAAEDRARQAELDKAKAEVYAAEQRKRRRVWLGLAAALLLGVFASSGLALWANHARETAEIAQQNEATAKQLETTAREKAEQSQRDEEKAKHEAIEQANLATGVKDYLLKDLFELGDPAKQQREQAEGLVKMDPDLKVRDLIVRASQKIEGRFADQPLVEVQIRWTLGVTLRGMGRADLAVTQYERMRHLYSRKLGPDHPDTLRSMNNLALIYADLGRPADALKLHEETLALMKQKFGPDHPATLKGMNNLALIYADLGRPADALKLREETLALMKQKLGPDHPDTLRSMSNLANSYDDTGRSAEALQIREKTLALRKQKFGPDHPATLWSMSNLANSYIARGRHAEALKLREETLALCKQKLGSDHPDTLLNMNNLALSYADLGRHVEALKLREETLALRKRKLGPDHPETLLSMYVVVESHIALKRTDEAIPLIRETLKLVPQAEAAGKRPDPQLVSSLIACMLRIAGGTRDSELAREAAERWEDLKRTDVGSLYDAACYRAVTASFCKDKAEAKTEADKAIVWLKKAIAAGFDKDRGYIETDDDLEALHDRADFKELMASLSKSKPKK